MKKIPTIFARNEKQPWLVTNVMTPGCEWVFSGEGTATKKFDGTACMIKEGTLYKRTSIDVPVIPHLFEPDFIFVYYNTKKKQAVGWKMCSMFNPTDKWYLEGFNNLMKLMESVHKVQNDLDGTYELCGPRINGNPEQFGEHVLVRHGAYKIYKLYEIGDLFGNKFEMTFDSVRNFLKDKDIEGIVWYHSEDPSKMAKIKKRDFGFVR